MAGGRSLMIGSFGWDWEAWQGPFYPEDMPADWRLTFYSNEFGCVLVPSDVWSSEPDVDAWREDAPEGFRFYLEVSGELADGPYRDRLLQAAQTLGPLCGGAVAEAGARDRGLDRLGQLGVPVYTLEDDEAVPPVWRPGVTACPCAPLAWVRFGGDPDARALREVIEGFVGCAGDEDLAMILETSPGVLRDAQAIARLMGY